MDKGGEEISTAPSSASQSFGGSNSRDMAREHSTTERKEEAEQPVVFEESFDRQTGKQSADTLLGKVKSDGIEEGWNYLADEESFSKKPQNPFEERLDVSPGREETEEEGRNDHTKKDKQNAVERIQEAQKHHDPEALQKELQDTKDQLEQVKQERDMYKNVIKNIFITMDLYQKEDDEKEKNKLLDLLVQMVAAIMKGIMTGDPSGKEGKK